MNQPWFPLLECQVLVIEKFQPAVFMDSCAREPREAFASAACHEMANGTMCGPQKCELSWDTSIAKVCLN